MTVLPLVHLLHAHGIAVEAHAQNMVLVHSAGRPRRLAVKDFHDGVRFSRSHLADPGRCPELAATPEHHTNRNSFVETDDPALVTDFLPDALLFVNLGELAMLLADTYGFAEQEFWAVVRTAIRSHQRRFPQLADRFAVCDVFKPSVAVEKLTTRRLLPDTELRLHAVPNAVHRVHAVYAEHGVPFCAIPRTREDHAQWRAAGVRAFVLGEERGVAARALRAHLADYRSLEKS